MCFDYSDIRDTSIRGNVPTNLLATKPLIGAESCPFPTSICVLQNQTVPACPSVAFSTCDIEDLNNLPPFEFPNANDDQKPVLISLIMAVILNLISGTVIIFILNSIKTGQDRELDRRSSPARKLPEKKTFVISTPPARATTPPKILTAASNMYTAQSSRPDGTIPYANPHF